MGGLPVKTAVVVPVLDRCQSLALHSVPLELPFQQGRSDHRIELTAADGEGDLGNVERAAGGAVGGISLDHGKSALRVDPAGLKLQCLEDE